MSRPVLELPRSVAAALAAAGITAKVDSIAALSGGCIHRVIALRFADNTSLVAKVNRGAGIRRVFEGEASGLHALERTGMVVVPHPLAVGENADEAALLITHFQAFGHRPGEDAWVRFGQDLAALHDLEAGSRYGFDTDNHIGSTPQVNAWCDDWVEFNARNRLKVQLEFAQQHGHLTSNEAGEIGRVIANLDHFIPGRPTPSLLHGDLWSGNVMPTVDGSRNVRIALIDPSCSIGDGLADVAMMQLFGVFPASCFAAYAEVRRIDLSTSVSRRAIGAYQLYHLLNHVNLFGRSYATHAMGLARMLLES